MFFVSQFNSSLVPILCHQNITTNGYRRHTGPGTYFIDICPCFLFFPKFHTCLGIVEQYFSIPESPERQGLFLILMIDGWIDKFLQVISGKTPIPIFNRALPCVQSWNFAAVWTCVAAYLYNSNRIQSRCVCRTRTPC